MLSSSRQLYYQGEKAEFFDYTLGLFQNYQLQARFVLFQIEQEKSLTSSINILELGCGTGTLLRFLADSSGNSINLVGVDISTNMVEIARTKCKSNRIQLFTQDAVQFLRENKQVFDCIIFLFNFIQGFFNIGEISSFLSLVSEHLSRDGVAIFDWHNEPIFRKNHPPGIRTKLELPLEQTHGKTICYIASSYFGPYKEISCYFKVNRRLGEITQLTTRHHLLTLAHRDIERVLASSGLTTVVEVADYSGTKFDKNVSERCISVVRRIGYADQIQAIVKQRLIDAHIFPLGVSIVGSSTGIAMRPKEGDIDLLLILSNAFFQNKNSFTKINSILNYLCKQKNIDRCEFRHGPFKQVGKLQLHALIHSKSTILDVPIITRWVWYLHARDKISLNTLFRKIPTKQSLLVSCKREVQHLYQQFNKSIIEYREWLFDNQPKLCVMQMKITSEEMSQIAFRYFILAAASDTAAVWNVYSNMVEWFHLKFPSEMCFIVKLVTQEKNSKISYKNVELFLKTLIPFLRKSEKQTSSNADSVEKHLKITDT